MRARSNRFRGWAAFRYGRLLPDTIRATRQQCRLYVQAMFLQEVRCGMHRAKDVLRDHGIEVARATVTRDDGG